jgi:hypothetical protein
MSDLGLVTLFSVPVNESWRYKLEFGWNIPASKRSNTKLVELGVGDRSDEAGPILRSDEFTDE